MCWEQRDSHILSESCAEALHRPAWDSEIWKQEGTPDALVHVYVFMLNTSECFAQSRDQMDR